MAVVTSFRARCAHAARALPVRIEYPIAANSLSTTPVQALLDGPTHGGAPVLDWLHRGYWLKVAFFHATPLPLDPFSSFSCDETAVSFPAVSNGTMDVPSSWLKSQVVVAMPASAR